MMGASGSLEVPSILHRRSPGGGRHCHRHLGLRVAAQGRREIQGPLSRFTARRHRRSPSTRTRASSTASAAASAATSSSSSSCRTRSASAKRCARSPAASAFRFRNWKAAASSAKPPLSARRSSRFTRSRSPTSANSSRRPAARVGASTCSRIAASPQETIDQLQIGWAPPARDALRQRLLKAGFNPAAARDERAGHAARRWHASWIGSAID